MEQKQFKLVSNHKPMGDQPTAIESLVEGLRKGKKYQVLLGATGSIGTQSVHVIVHHPEAFTLVAMACGKNIAKLREFLPFCCGAFCNSINLFNKPIS